MNDWVCKGNKDKRVTCDNIIHVGDNVGQGKLISVRTNSNKLWLNATKMYFTLSDIVMRSDRGLTNSVL